MAKVSNRLDNEQATYETTASDNGTHQRVKLVDSESAFAWTQLGPVTVPAGATVVIDTNLLSTFSRIDYILNFKDSPVTVTRSMKMVVQNNAGTVTDMVSERMGGPISLNIGATDDAVDAFIEITNNEAFDVEVVFLRAITP